MVARVRGALRVASFLAPALAPLHRAVGERAAAAVGRRLEFTTPGGYAALEPNRIDVAFVCGPPLLARADRYEAVAAPVLAVPGVGGRPVYWSEVVVAASRPWRCFADLRGATLAYNEPESFSGHHCVRAHLAALGETGAFFRGTVEAGFHDAALAMVLDGRADVAAIDVHVLALAVRDGRVPADALRTVASLGPVPVQPVVVSRALPDPERAAVVVAVVGAEGPGFAGSLVERFVPVAPDHAEPLRRLLDRADAAGIDLRDRSRDGAWG